MSYNPHGNTGNRNAAKPAALHKPKRTRTVSFTVDDLELWKPYASAEGISLAEWIRRACAKYI